MNAAEFDAFVNDVLAFIREPKNQGIICERAPEKEIVPVPSHHGVVCRTQHSHAHPEEPGDEMPDGVCCEGRLVAVE
jgi:hypothetical protein